MPKQTKNMENKTGTAASGTNIRLRPRPSLFMISLCNPGHNNDVSEAEAQLAVSNVQHPVYDEGTDESTSSIETPPSERSETTPGVESDTDEFAATDDLGSNAEPEIPGPQPTTEDYSSIDSYSKPNSPPSSPTPVGLANLIGYGEQAEFTNYIGRKNTDDKKDDGDKK